LTVLTVEPGGVGVVVRWLVLQLQQGEAKQPHHVEEMADPRFDKAPFPLADGCLGDPKLFRQLLL
jgi:hypothetical protein